MDLARHSVREMLVLYTNVITELKARGVIRRSDQPVGDYAAFLVASARGGALQENSNCGFDVVMTDGSKWEVKSRRLTPENRSKELGDLGRSDTWKFDTLAAVLFEHDFTVLRACAIPRAMAAELIKTKSDGKRRIIYLSDSVCHRAGVIDLAPELRRVGGN
jgi:hypothetical protein